MTTRLSFASQASQPTPPMMAGRGDKELGETISMHRRALAILEKEMGKGAFLQTAAMTKVAASLEALVEASSLSTLDKTKLQVLLETSEDDTQEPAEKGQSKGIIETMEDMLEKSEAQMSAGQKAEMEAAHNFDMLKLSLEDGIKAETKELAESKKENAPGRRLRHWTRPWRRRRS